MNISSIDETDIEAALSLADAKLGRLITAVASKTGRLRISPSRSSPFEALVRAVIYQQLSDAAAARIYKGLQQSAGAILTPEKVLALPHDKLRAIGLSQSKTQYVRNLADWFNANAGTAKNFAAMSNDEVIEALTSISGIGVWTANVFLIFNLQRLDVVAASDLGIRRGVQLAYGLKSIATPDFVFKKALRWQPFRSIASIYLWNAVKLKISPDALSDLGPLDSRRALSRMDRVGAFGVGVILRGLAPIEHAVVPHYAYAAKPDAIH
jgi:DNA-3-methyladenine glycosylase II